MEKGHDLLFSYAGIPDCIGFSVQNTTTCTKSKTHYIRKKCGISPLPITTHYGKKYVIAIHAHNTEDDLVCDGHGGAASAFLGGMPIRRYTDAEISGEAWSHIRQLHYRCADMRHNCGYSSGVPHRHDACFRLQGAGISKGFSRSSFRRHEYTACYSFQRIKSKKKGLAVCHTRTTSPLDRFIFPSSFGRYCIYQPQPRGLIHAIT